LQMLDADVSMIYKSTSVVQDDFVDRITFPYNNASEYAVIATKTVLPRK
jgi:hypothetical protein